MKVRGERAGILGKVILGVKALEGWESFADVVREIPKEYSEHADCSGPCFYRGELDVKQPGDTYLNTTEFGKGVIRVNGHRLGRFWSVGPLGSLYLPGAWLHAGRNHVTVFDLNGGSEISLRGDKEVQYLPAGLERASPVDDRKTKH